jgi:hypothetical protein
MEEDICKVSNDYYYLTERYDKKINDIVNRYEGRTNNLFIDLRRREGDCIKIRKIIDNIINSSEYNKTTVCLKFDIKDIDQTQKNILLFLYMYTLFVISIIISNFGGLIY